MAAEAASIVGDGLHRARAAVCRAGAAGTKSVKKLCAVDEALGQYRMYQVYIGTSIFLIAVGAILRYAVTADVEGINLDTAGLILMIVGVVGLLFSLLWMTIWADRRRDAVVADRPVVTDPARERVVERDRY
jgi:uncharacterized membrane protein